MASFLSTLFGGGAEREAAERNRALYQNYQNQGTTFLDNGLNSSVGVVTGGRDAALAAYDPLLSLAEKYGRGSDLLLDAYGANGAAGNERAKAAFQTSPGYDFTREQGLEAVNRRRAVAGGWDSGNTDIDLLKFSQGLADSEYGNWRSGLSQFVSPELAAASGAASGKAGISTNSGNLLASLYSQDASDRIGLVGNTTSGMASANNTEAAGRAAGARNLLNAGLGIASVATGGLGGMGAAAGGAPSTLSHMFSTTFGNGTGYQQNPWARGGQFV